MQDGGEIRLPMCHVAPSNDRRVVEGVRGTPFAPGIAFDTPGRMFCRDNSMLYRKASPRPPRLLLRIAATAGASALVGVAACSSSSDSPSSRLTGSVVSPPADDAGDAASNPVTIMTGIMANPDATACGGGVCGSVVMPQDGGDAGDFAPDAENDAESMDATDDVTHCGGVCGVIVRPDQ